MLEGRSIRFGILGAGMVAEYHRQAIEHLAAEGAQLACVAYRDPRRFDEVSSRFGVPCVDEDALLTDPSVDAICICTPSGQHAAQTLAAARAGKHVLVEKPMALSLHDADRMIRTCEEAGVVLGIVYQRRHDPTFQDVRARIERGELGELTMAVLSMPYYRGQSYYDSAAWRGTWSLDGGGVLMNQGIHMVDLLLWYMGEPVDVAGRAGTVHHEVEVEDVAAASLRFPNGAVGVVAATTTAAPGFAHRLEIYGTRGGIQIEGERLMLARFADGDATPVVAPDVPHEAGAGGDPRGIAPIGHVRAVRDFMASIREGRSPVVDGSEGRRSLALVLDVYRAAGLVLT